MNVLHYPLHPCRKFERRWSAQVIQDDGQPLSSRGPDGCTACGRLVAAPVHATYLPNGKIVDQWRCPVCRNAWQTSADPASNGELQSSRSERLRDRAGHCQTLEGTAPDDAGRKQFGYMGEAWIALAETQDWLDGVTPPLSRA